MSIRTNEKWLDEYFSKEMDGISRTSADGEPRTRDARKRAARFHDRVGPENGSAKERGGRGAESAG